MNFLPIIEAKRDGQSVSADQIRELVAGYTAGEIPDYQMAAFLMAVFFRGLDQGETVALTLAMRDSGEHLRFPADTRPLVDKHSTGGVGDKVSLPLAPLLACLDFRVPMISGRGLGITGGTLDKLDSIPGFKTSLSAEEIIDTVQNVGCVICGQTATMVPADKALYSLRDVTGTVPSIPLIVASILSKKLAESLQALVLDVKFGAAAFMRDLDAARHLATAMVDLANDCGVKTGALLSPMDTPLGRSAGNWLEVKESVQCLEGNGPADLEALVLACAAQLLVQTGRAPNERAGLTTARECLHSGKPLEKWAQMVAAQGGDLGKLEEKLHRDVCAKVVKELNADSGGVVSKCDARTIGEAVRELGGGRATKDSTLDYDVGIDRIAKPGEKVSTGTVLARIHARDERAAERACAQVRNAFEISERMVEPQVGSIEIIPGGSDKSKIG